MRPEDMTEEQRLILHQYATARDMMERLAPYLKTLIPPKFEIGQLVLFVGQSGGQNPQRGGLRIYNRFLTEGASGSTRCRRMTGRMHISTRRVSTKTRSWQPRSEWRWASGPLFHRPVRAGRLWVWIKT